MQTFYFWLETGFQHILDLTGYDHICYVVALSIIYGAKEWKKLLFLVSAFTLGHSLSLALSVTNVVQIPQSIIEILIPLTIMLTCINNFFAIQNEQKFPIRNYGMALFFGLIHGLGFSYLLKAMLGKSENILFPLFSFNVGLEIGQLVVVSAVLGLSYVFLQLLKINKIRWVQIVSAIVFCVSVYLLSERR